MLENVSYFGVNKCINRKFACFQLVCFYLKVFVLLILFQKEDLDSEDDKGNQDLSQKIPQGTEHVPKVFGSALQGLPDR